jgi:hypothetical protein
MRQPFIVPSIRGRDIGFFKWPDIRSFKHLLQLLDVINYAFDVHRQQYSQPALTRHFAPDFAEVRRFGRINPSPTLPLFSARRSLNCHPERRNAIRFVNRVTESKDPYHWQDGRTADAGKAGSWNKPSRARCFCQYYF